MNRDRAVREHLLNLLRGRGAHLDPQAVIADFPEDLRGARPPGLDRTPWQLLEHLRIAQWDILEFSRDPDHLSPTFPEGYWPEFETPSDAGAWERSVESFGRDLEQMQELVGDPQIDLLTPIPHGQGQTVLREALLVADHNAYHLGQLVILRRLLGAWPPR
jgi:hypothetical protein